MYACLGINAENSIESLITKKKKKNIESRFHSKVAAFTLIFSNLSISFTTHANIQDGFGLLVPWASLSHTN